jgi:hypothetical protein
MPGQTTQPPTGQPPAPSDLAALQKAVENEVTVDQSAITLIKGVAAHVTKLASQPNVAPSDLSALAKKLNDSAAALAAAVTANTPAEH